MGRHPPIQTELFDVLVSNFQGVFRDVNRINLGAWKRQGSQNRQTTRACAQIKHVINVIGFRDPGRQLFGQQLRNR